MRVRVLFTALLLATLTSFAQTTNDDIMLTAREFGLASISKDIRILDGVQEIGVEAFHCFKSTIFQRSGSGTLYIPKSVYSIGDHAVAMTRNGWGMCFNSKRKILCLPNHVNLDNCKDMGISREPVEEYLKSIGKF